MHAEASYDFDWDALYSALGEPEAAPDNSDRERLAFALAAVFDYILSVDLGDKAAPDSITSRTIALAWTIAPARFGNASIRRLAKRMGLSAAHLSTKSADAGRKFGISNQFKGHDWRNSKVTT